MHDHASGSWDRPGVLEDALVDLGAALDYPPTPPLAASLATHLRGTGAAEPRLRRPLLGSWRRSLVLGILAALLLVGVATALGIGLGGLRIVFTTQTPSPLPLPSGVIGSRVLGTETDIASARQWAGFTVRVPQLDALGAPDHVFFSSLPRGGTVALTWTGRVGYPADRSGVGVVVTQFRADIDPGIFEKLVNSGQTTVTPATVNGVPGWWISGGEHYFFYRDADGNVVNTTLRLVGETLLWEERGIVYRVEGAPSLEAAQRIAVSLR